MLLHGLADAAGFDTVAGVDMWQVGEALGFELETVQSLVRQLSDERLVALRPEAGAVSVSSVGLAAVNLAKAFPDRPSPHFPALSGFFGLGDDSGSALCRHSISVLLDQLDDCRGLLASRHEPSAHLEQRLVELERAVTESRVEPTSLRQGLQRLRESLTDS